MKGEGKIEILITSLVVKMTGWRILMSKAGITTLVNVSFKVKSPTKSFTTVLSCFPSYLGPVACPNNLKTPARKCLYNYLQKNQTTN